MLLKYVSESFNFRRQSNAEFLLQICQKGKNADILGTPRLEVQRSLSYANNLKPSPSTAPNSHSVAGVAQEFLLVKAVEDYKPRFT